MQTKNTPSRGFEPRMYQLEVQRVTSAPRNRLLKAEFFVVISLERYFLFRIFENYKSLVVDVKFDDKCSQNTMINNKQVFLLIYLLTWCLCISLKSKFIYKSRVRIDNITTRSKRVHFKNPRNIAPAQFRWFPFYLTNVHVVMRSIFYIRAWKPTAS